MRENIVQDWHMDKQEEIDCRDCWLVESVAGRCAGRPTIKGTRVEPDTIVENFEAGSPVEEIAENYPTLPVSTIREVIAFAHKHQPVP
jgi:uncharacterized protein (DUF433 family)